jgi:FtsP/CotA-like multicopper oxidase with cupredoxin domain
VIYLPILKHLLVGILLACLCVFGAACSTFSHAEENKHKQNHPVHLSEKQISHQDQISNNLVNEREISPKTLPDGTKEFILTASVFPWQLYPGKNINVWGYNQQVPGPLIRVKEGDKVAVVVHNRLPQPTTIHWHGLAVPNSMDGVPMMKMKGMEMGTQKAIPKGGTFTYRFTVTPQMIGTHYYHTHFNDFYQVDMGLHGVLIVDPAVNKTPKYDVDALYELGSFKVDGSDAENVFVLNGKAFPDAPVLDVKVNQTVRIRLVNASAEEFHVMHLHGYTFSIIALDGNPVAVPQEANTVTLGPSQTADIAFKATNPGQWMFHCHILDHTVNPGAEDNHSSKHMDDMGGLTTFINVK